jgi:hypothetical protein
MVICIYCRQSKGPFTREHVVHEGFGKFKGALVIHKAVCHDCNHEFSRTIDLAITRSSIWGFERYKVGVKTPAEFAKFKHSSMTLRVIEPGDSQGAQLVLRADNAGEKLVSHVLPGIGVRGKNGKEFVHFDEAQVRNGSWLQNTEVDWRRGIKVYGDETKREEIRAVLERQGVTLSDWRPLKPSPRGKIAVDQEFPFSSAIRRALAKIAFNYLTYCKGTAYALLDAFDPIRNYIRFGEMPLSSSPPVQSVNGLPFSKIYAGAVVLESGSMRPVIHVLSLRTNGERHVVGAISLFGAMTHHVVLAEAMKGPLLEACAHLYNIKLREVYPLVESEP